MGWAFWWQDLLTFGSRFLFGGKNLVVIFIVEDRPDCQQLLKLWPSPGRGCYCKLPLKASGAPPVKTLTQHQGRFIRPRSESAPRPGGFYVALIELWQQSQITGNIRIQSCGSFQFVFQQQWFSLLFKCQAKFRNTPASPPPPPPCSLAWRVSSGLCFWAPTEKLNQLPSQYEYYTWIHVQHRWCTVHHYVHHTSVLYMYTTRSTQLYAEQDTAY